MEHQQIQKITPEIIAQWADALKEANQAALDAKQGDDGGTCNFDTPVLDFTGWRPTQIEVLSRLSGIPVGEKMNGYWKNCRFVWVILEGQANMRSRMAEAAVKKLQAKGLPAHFWQQAD
jgi:hypothetical protein